MSTKYEGGVGASQDTPVVATSEVVIGRLVDLDDSGRPIVVFTLGEYQGRAVALSTQPLRRQDIERDVALLFAAGQALNPVIMGFIHSPLTAVLHGIHDRVAEPLEPAAALTTADERGIAPPTSAEPSPGLLDLPITHTATETRIDGKRLVFAAQEEVLIQCGEASISLNKNGKVTIRGKYVLTRASGVNRILGGSVQVN